ncbi:response regulator [Autumnicola edwardsiae]|uniref:Response regulator n=1 Tax=Autumnicola edwardsiae TaxID=3075594 RepID=A0ABU3CSI7_9FLAO|nr:response regulator [Zunongwangia sp. F297]MDT0649320.1 response regulator [Zunongwangia sp. F297]
MKLEVIIIDDDKILRKVLKRIIQICNLTKEVLEFENGEDALAYFSSENYNSKKAIIFLDINMPRINGWEFLQEMKKQNLLQNKEIYLLTSSIDKTEHCRAEQDPFIKDILIKPLTIEKFKGLIS